MTHTLAPALFPHLERVGARGSALVLTPSKPEGAPYKPAVGLCGQRRSSLSAWNKLHHMQLYAISDRRQLPAGANLSDQVDAWAAAAVDFIQLREKDLNDMELNSLATQLAVRLRGRRTRLLLNISTPEGAAIALAAGAAGVHLAGPPIAGAVARVRQTFRDAVLSVPCHSLQEIEIARKEQVDLMLFSPVFEKGSRPPQGLEALKLACAAARGIPVFALGGVTPANAPDCVAAGAAGVAGIRLFSGNNWRELEAGAAHPPHPAN